MCHFCTDFLYTKLHINFYTWKFPHSSPSRVRQNSRSSVSNLFTSSKGSLLHTVNKTHGGANSQTGRVGTHFNILCHSIVKYSPPLTMEFPWSLRFPSLMSRYFAPGLRLVSQDSVKCCQCFYGWCPTSEPGACEQTVSQLKWTGQFSGKHGLSIGLLFTAAEGKRIMDLLPVKRILDTEEVRHCEFGQTFLEK